MEARSWEGRRRVRAVHRAGGTKSILHPGQNIPDRDKGGCNDGRIVEYLEARIAEESAVRECSFVLVVPEDSEGGSEDNASLRECMLDEYAQKSAIIASWKEAADAEGLNDPTEAGGTIVTGRRAMLTRTRYSANY